MLLSIESLYRYEVRSYSGLHAIDRHSKGYPLEILEQALKASNGVNGMVAVLGSILSGQATLTKDVYQSFKEFSDCFQSKPKVL